MTVGIMLMLSVKCEFVAGSLEIGKEMVSVAKCRVDVGVEGLSLAPQLINGQMSSVVVVRAAIGAGCDVGDLGSGSFGFKGRIDGNGKVLMVDRAAGRVQGRIVQRGVVVVAVGGVGGYGFVKNVEPAYFPGEGLADGNLRRVGLMLSSR